MQEAERLKKEAQLLADYYSTFSSESGQRVLESLEQEFSECSYEKDGPIYATVFNEGRRALFLKIKENIELGRDPEKSLEEQSYTREE